MTERLCPVCACDVPAGNAFCGACGARMPVSESTATDDGLLGRVIDSRFRVLRLLGAGGMGAVYLAEHVGIGKKVAVKVLRADLRSHRDLVGRFRREAMAVSKLTDAHTITVFDFGVWRGLVYLVMEYLRGCDLAELLDREQRLEPVRALRIAHQVCSSLGEAHAVGIVHRDLKPDNVFVSRTTSGDELVKVLDFGLAKILAPSERPQGGFVTQDGALLGTPYFMAPEQVRSEAVDSRADLYSLGALLFRMLTGTYPYRGRSPMEVLEGHLSGNLPTFHETAPDLNLPSPCEALVRRLMQREPDRRPATAMEADAGIMAALGELEGASGAMRAVGVGAPWGGAPAAPGVPSSFSTSSVGEPPPVDTEPHVPPELDELPFEAPTRDEFAAYERRLKAKAWFVRFALVVVLVGGAYGGWRYVEGRPYEPPAREVEPNDDSRNATRIVAGIPISGYIGRRSSTERSDRDVFQVEVPADRPYVEVEVTGVPYIDLVIEGFDLAGTALFKHNGAGEGEGEHLRGTRVDRPKLMVVLREVWVHGQRPTENSTDPYRLVVRFHRDPPPDAPPP